MRSSDVTVVFAAMSVGMEKLLTSHGVIRTAGGRDGDEADIVIDTVDGALGTVCPSVCLSVRQSVCLSVRLSVSPSVCLSVCC